MRKALRPPGPRARLILVMAVFGLLTTATVLVAYPKIFTGFAPYDDEGGLLIALRSFFDHGSLYDEVFSQYGPFYFELWKGVFSLFGIALTHDTGRLATLVAWTSSSLLLGLSIYRISRSVVLGAAVQMLVFAALITLIYEPMHPAGLTCALLALVVAVSTFVGTGGARYAMALLGVAVAAILLVKVNIGAFALVALLVACSSSFPAIASRRWLRSLIRAGFVLTPVVVMAGELDQTSVQHYCAHVVIAALAVVLLLESRVAEPWREAGELRWLAAGLLGAAVPICALALAGGTSPGGLFDGVISQPLRQAGAFSVPIRLPDSSWLLDFTALAGAGVCFQMARLRSEPGLAWGAVLALASIVVGVEMGLSAIGRSFPFDFADSSFVAHSEGSRLSLLGFAWVALIPIPGVELRGGREFARRLLPPLAVLQALHAYPVAGSQIGWSAFLLVPVGAICVSNGVRGLAQVGEGTRRRQRLGAAGLAVGLALTIFVADVTLRRPYDESRDTYYASRLLGLPGASNVRVPAAEATRYRRISQALEKHCDTYISLPGLNSFYLWTGEQPPTQINATHWMTLLGDDQQRRIVAAARPLPGMCLLENNSIARFWLQGRELPQGPLLTFMRDSFEPLARFGPYVLLKRIQGQRNVFPSPR